MTEHDTQRLLDQLLGFQQALEAAPSFDDLASLAGAIALELANRELARTLAVAGREIRGLRDELGRRALEPRGGDARIGVKALAEAGPVAIVAVAQRGDGVFKDFEFGGGDLFAGQCGHGRVFGLRRVE